MPCLCAYSDACYSF